MRIVLTGGPSAGKTTIAEVVARTLNMALVPESASILFRGGFPRSVAGPGMCYQQLAIFHVQRQIENVIKNKNPGVDMICDRGTLDGLAYWEEDPQAFLQAVHTSIPSEFQRYDWVLDLDTVSPSFYSANSLRIESPDQAATINRRIGEIWGAHPNYIRVGPTVDFDKKIKKVLTALELIYQGEPVETIRAELASERFA